MEVLNQRNYIIAVFFQFHLKERWVYGCAN